MLKAGNPAYRVTSSGEATQRTSLALLIIVCQRPLTQVLIWKYTTAQNDTAAQKNSPPA